MNIYDVRRYGSMIFLAVSLCAIGFLLYYSHSLVEDLAAQERAHMQIWADATREIANVSDSSAVDMNFLLKIIEDNRSIPVILADADDNVLLYRNLDMTSGDDAEALQHDIDRRLNLMREAGRVIDVQIGPGDVQYIYYDDSHLLRSLSRYPYVMLAVLLLFVAVMYSTLNAIRKAEQNKVWAGLSKETAHQLGTPISSLMAWIDLLEAEGVDRTVTDEMNKDVSRLSTIASRFSKIGSLPVKEADDVAAMLQDACRYMSGRISSQVNLEVSLPDEAMPAMMSRPLMEWVIENLIKNAVDAMAGSGLMKVTASCENGKAVIEVADTGCGISRRNFRNVFRPGFTTRQRGWGLGLTLAKRIVEQYHGGRIFIKSSELGRGTTFRIELPLLTHDDI